MSSRESWKRYRQWLFDAADLGFRLDVSRMDLPPDLPERIGPEMEAAFDAMEALERGSIANPDEGRMVGHYWLRAPELAPDDKIRETIERTVERVLDFAARVHRGELRPPGAERFERLLVVLMLTKGADLGVKTLYVVVLVLIGSAAAAFAGMVPGQGQQGGGVATRITDPRQPVHGRRALEHPPRIDSLQRRGKQAHRAQLRGAPADPVPHRKAIQESSLLGEAVQPAALPRDGHGVGAEL